MKRLNRVNKLRPGEIIRIKSKFGIPSSGVYRVDAVAGELLMMSAGEIRCGASLQSVEVVERNITKPIDWLDAEIQILKAQSELCDCEQCKSILNSKQKLAEGRKSVVTH